jgi:uncharacterized repeat protein (TIGR02543 family)
VNGANGSQSASVPGGNFNVGETVTLSATPSTGYTFSGWTVNSGGVTISNNSFTMPAGNVTVTANYVIDSSGPLGDSDGDGVINQDDNFPNDPNRASGNDKDNDGIDDEFDTSYAVSITSSNGSVTGSGQKTVGSTVTLAATPDSGYTFSGWTVNSGGVTISNNSFTMPDNNVSITANYTVTYHVSAANYGGTKELEMIYVEPGTFMMGSPTTEAGRGHETLHQVTLTEGFYLSKYEVTQAQYESVMTGNTSGLSATPSSFSGNPDNPVERVSWEDAYAFISRLNQQAPNGWIFALPTEAQWEYACRAGTTTKYSWGNSINSSLLRYNQNISPVEVGSYPPNNWGFHDMHGNVEEWVRDLYAPQYGTDAVTDPYSSENTGVSASGTYPVLRGGNYYSSAADVRSAKRNWNNIWRRNPNFGFRVALIQSD